MVGNINGILYIYGYDGRLYHQSEIYEQIKIIDISSLNRGIYIVSVKTKYRTDQGTFIKL
ncbi:MAG: T9SS type A sorting domain-containing protein [Bacteroidales bacterium]|nr:T9SS type A sorting domain-containing protein [Bacteroidales bacterium]